MIWAFVSIDCRQASAQTGSTPFTITIAADRGPFEAGSDIFVKVTESNTSEGIINCGVRDTNGVDLSFDYSVWDPSGRLMQPRKDAEAYFSSMRVCKLKPKASFANEQLISWLYNMSIPGEYRVQVSRVVSDQPGTIVVKSNIILVEIMAHKGSAQ